MRIIGCDNYGPHWNADRDPSETFSSPCANRRSFCCRAVISLRRSCASKDGCNTESNVRPSRDR